MSLDALSPDHRRLAEIILAEADRRIAESERLCKEGQDALSSELGDKMQALEIAAAKEQGANEEFRDATVRTLAAIQADVKANGDAAVQGAQMATQTAETLSRISDRLYEMNGKQPADDQPHTVQALKAVANPWAAASIAILLLAAALSWALLGGTASDVTEIVTDAPAAVQP